MQSKLFTEWLAEVEARIEAIIAERKGEGVPLTRHQARALAGEWYDWFAARHAATDRDWSEVLDEVQDAMRQFVGEKRWEVHDPNELWEHDAELRKATRPVLADVAETAQFLATRAVILNNEARNLFLDFLYHDLAEAPRSGGCRGSWLIPGQDRER